VLYAEGLLPHPNLKVTEEITAFIGHLSNSQLRKANAIVMFAMVSYKGLMEQHYAMREDEFMEPDEEDFTIPEEYGLLIADSSLDTRAFRPHDLWHHAEAELDPELLEFRRTSFERAVQRTMCGCMHSSVQTYAEESVCFQNSQF
jgi:hypothetical protein